MIVLTFILWFLMLTRVGPGGRSGAAEGRLWEPKEVADYLGIPVETLYQWRHRGTGPRSLKVGKHLRYRPADIEAYLEAAAAGSARS